MIAPSDQSICLRAFFEGLPFPQLDAARFTMNHAFRPEREPLDDQ
jgi:hypothetical protein